MKFSLLDYIAYIHGLHTAVVFANSQSVKNSLQQMKHNVKKQESGQSSIKRTSTTTEQVLDSHENLYEGDEL